MTRFNGVCVATVLVAMLATGTAWGADLGTPAAKRTGTALVIAGVAVQLGGIGFATASLFDDEIAASVPRLVYHGSTIPFAVLTVIGFERLLADGNVASRHRALAAGFFEGMAYAGAVALLSALELLVGPSPGEDSPATDVGSIFSFGYFLSHLPVMVGLMIPGIVSAMRADRGVSARRSPVFVTPWDDGQARGVAIVGRF